jgi:thioesterase domain-containing protein
MKEEPETRSGSSFILPPSSFHNGARLALVALQPRGSRPPFFCVHPAGGLVFCYRELAQHLGPDQPVFGLQAAGLHAGHRPHGRVEAMAAYYIEELRTLQPRGPYLLGGWSMGGVVAFEMARQLRRLGQRVGLLALADSYIPRFEGRPPELDSPQFFTGFARQTGLDVSPEALARGGAEERLALLLEYARAARLLPADVGPVQVRRLYRRHARVFRANVRALRQYVPEPSPGRVILLRAAERGEQTARVPTWDWAELAGEVEVHAVPGDHYSIVREPHVVALAECLRACLEAAARDV